MKNAASVALAVLALVAVQTGCATKKPKTSVATTPDETVEITNLIGRVPPDQDPNRTLVQNTGIGPVYFDFDSSAVPSGEIFKLQQAADYLRQNPTFDLIVAGHCDERGSNEYNLSLGEQRAITLRSALVDLGISPDRIWQRSYGEENPAVLGTGEAVWRQNRRGEFAFYK